MKKLLAIVLSALLLCTALPFATVSADDAATIVVSQMEANAGDEIEIEVKLLNNPGIISAKIEILYDESVMELVSYYDEDEDDYFNMITPASGWSSKYITYGPVGDCLMNFCNGTAKKNVTVEDFFTATFKIKEDAASGTYPLTIKYDPADFFDMDLQRVEFAAIDGYVVINGNDPEPPACEHEYDSDYDADCNICGEQREVPTLTPGDADGNGKVNNRDLGILQQYLNDWDTTIVLEACDVDGSGKVNNRDLGVLQQYLNDWDVELK